MIKTHSQLLKNIVKDTQMDNDLNGRDQSP